MPPLSQNKILALLTEAQREAVEAADGPVLVIAGAGSGKTLQLFVDHPDVLEKYRRRIAHILVDEYRDTNRPQYLLVKLLAGSDGNVFVVGDDWQAIYAFRGSDYRNILRFHRDWPNAKVFFLEENFRSTGTIVEAANHAAKSLGFPFAFLIGCEEEIFPHASALCNEYELKEERRLAYVALTRAKEEAHLTHAKTRLYFGRLEQNPPSRFLTNISDPLILAVDQTIIFEYGEENEPLVRIE